MENLRRRLLGDVNAQKILKRLDKTKEMFQTDLSSLKFHEENERSMSSEFDSLVSKWRDMENHASELAEKKMVLEEYRYDIFVLKDSVEVAREAYKKYVSDVKMQYFE